MKFSHRIATPEDLGEIVAIYNSTIAAGLATADTAHISVDSRQQWFEEHREEVRPLWVAEAEGRIQGWLSFSNFYGRPAYDKTAELSVYIHGDFRGRGVGGYLLREAIAHAPAVGVDNLLGFIFGHNAPSLALFRKLGFVKWGELPRVATIANVERDLIILGHRA